MNKYARLLVLGCLIPTLALLASLALNGQAFLGQRPSQPPAALMNPEVPFRWAMYSGDPEGIARQLARSAKEGTVRQAVVTRPNRMEGLNSATLSQENLTAGKGTATK